MVADAGEEGEEIIEVYQWHRIYTSSGVGYVSTTGTLLHIRAAKIPIYLVWSGVSVSLALSARSFVRRREVERKGRWESKRMD